jgi:hypothetical protein
MNDKKLKNIFSEIDLTISTIEVKLDILKSQTQLVQHYVKGSLGDSVTQHINSLDTNKGQLKEEGDEIDALYSSIMQE